MDLHLAGKTALVVASSQGLGKAIAAQLVMEGANVMLASRNKEKLKEVEKELQLLGNGKVAHYSCDIKNAKEIKALVQYTRETYGGIQILINNSGGPPGGGFEDFQDDEWYHAFELNLLSYVRLIRESLPDLKKDGGKIINIASSSTKQPIPNLVLSNTFRLGVLGLGKSLAEELAPYNILVNTVSPGKIATDRVAYIDKLKAEKLGVSSEEVVEASKRDIPLGRYGEPEEFAKFVAFLASDANTYVTGTSLLVDGGMVKSI